MSKPSSTDPVFGPASPPTSHIKGRFSLVGQVFSFPFGLLHLSPKGILRSGLVLFATIPREHDWSSAYYHKISMPLRARVECINSRSYNGSVFKWRGKPYGSANPRSATTEMKRERRLQVAREWILEHTGKEFVCGYHPWIGSIGSALWTRRQTLLGRLAL